jgi:hypothetical protein
MLSPIHIFIFIYHIAVFSLLCEAIVKSIYQNCRPLVMVENMKKKPVQLNIMLSLFCVESSHESHSVLSPIRCKVHSRLIPFEVESQSGLSPV